MPPQRRSFVKSGKIWKPRSFTVILFFSAVAGYGYFGGKFVGRFGIALGLSMIVNIIVTFAVIFGSLALFFWVLKRRFPGPIAIPSRSLWMRTFFYEDVPTDKSRVD